MLQKLTKGFSREKLSNSKSWIFPLNCNLPIIRRILTRKIVKSKFSVRYCFGHCETKDRSSCWGKWFRTLLQSSKDVAKDKMTGLNKVFVIVILFFLQVEFSNTFLFLFGKKKKNGIYDPFSFHRQSDEFGQFEFRNGRKTYLYCYDVRCDPKLDCRPGHHFDVVNNQNNHYRGENNHYHHHHYHHGGWNSFDGNGNTMVSQLKNKFWKASKMQLKATYGLSLSPIRAHFQKPLKIPVFLWSNNEGHNDLT